MNADNYEKIRCLVDALVPQCLVPNHHNNYYSHTYRAREYGIVCNNPSLA